MATNKGNTNPESLKELKSIKITDEIRDFVMKLSQDVEEDLTNRSTWEQRIDKLKNLRYGIRNKKTFPWKNAANFSVPLADADIARAKPHYMNLINVTPVVNYVPFDGRGIDAARKREMVNDWRLRTEVKPDEQYAYGVDNLLEEGATIYKVLWKYTTRTFTVKFDLEDFDDDTLSVLFDPRVTDGVLKEIIVDEFGVNLELDENVDEIEKAIAKFRKGDSVFDMNFVEIQDDHPQLMARSLREEISIPIDTVLADDNLDDALRIDDIIWRSKNDIRIDMAVDKYIKYEDYEIEKWAEKQGNTRNGVVKSTPLDDNDMIQLHETCVWYDVNGDGVEEKCIVTWPDSSPGDVLRMIELPYDHGQWPYTLVKREWNDPGVYSSRGIPELDEDYQVGISTELNQTIDNGTIANTPKVIYKKNSLTNVRNAKYIPGEPVETKNSVADYDIRTPVNASQGLKLQIAQYLKGWANQRLGDVSQGLTDPTNMAGGGQGGKKTAKEVSLVAAMQGQTTALDLQIFQAQMARVYHQIDALYEQFGSRNRFEILTGEEKVDVNRSEIQGKFRMVPNGRLDNSNPAMRVMKAQNLFIMFNQDPMVDQYELRKNLLDEFDVKVSTKILKSKEQLQQEAQAQHQVIQESKGKKTREDLVIQKAMDELEINKEFVLSTFQGKKHSTKD